MIDHHSCSASLTEEEEEKKMTKIAFCLDPATLALISDDIDSFRGRQGSRRKRQVGA